MGEIRRSLSLALRAIGSAYSRGLAWMTPVLRGIVLVDTGDGTTTSGSSSSHPGLVYVSHPIDVHHLAAQLIHECAHQYLALLNGHERLVRVDCRETFYSPFKRAHRPLYNVLLAFHAAVNIKRLTSAMLRVGLRSGYLEQEDARLDGEIDQMHRDIASSEGWTPAGRRLLGELERAMA
nr:HEXXH motif-containing putative peptide modification protein [Luteibacter yeojuensis]